MMRRLTGWISGTAGAVCLLAAAPAPLHANPGHEVTIADLSAQILRDPPSPDLHFQRAWNYREIGRLPEARADWEQCLRLQPGFLPALRELARLDAAAGDMDEAIRRLRQALVEAAPDQAFHRPGCRSVLGMLLLEQGKNTEALAEAVTALQESPGLVMDLVLLRSEARRRLGQLSLRADELAAAIRQLRSFVLRARWLDAMIDAGRGAEVLPEIEQELANTRYQSSWLIRRARIRLHLDRPQEAAADLDLALSEITPRLHAQNPDVSLLCDRGLIHALQNRLPEAVADLTLARKKGADFWMTLSLTALLPSSLVPPFSHRPAFHPVSPAPAAGETK